MARPEDARDARRTLAIELMTRFAERTGLSPVREGPAPRRYLWTDAFAVCNFLGLARATGEQRYLELALLLVEQVHRTLGRHRPDDARRGWISGLPEAEGAAHPTRGGLRIGKPLPERGPGEPLDEELEWDRDGQYFHYLTKWTHALDRVARATGQPWFAGCARELAVAAHRGFCYAGRAGARRRMYWKMSIDLTRPLVPSMGHHDPLDGLVTCLELEAGARARGEPPDTALAEARADFAAMLEPDELATADPLGLGGLLIDASRLDRIARDAGADAGAGERELVDAMLAAAHAGLRHYAERAERRAPAARRLGFRELGLAIGLAAIEPMRLRAAESGAAAARRRQALAQLERFAPLRDELEAFWREPAHRAAPSWRAHEDINDVMLATSLLPDGFAGQHPGAEVLTG
jgi:hypothetical protein